MSNFLYTLLIRFGLGLLWLISFLPYKSLMFLGRGLGQVMYHLIKQRRSVARKNIELCFPELDKKDIDKLLREHFSALGMAVFELGISWWWSEERLKKLYSFDGHEHLDVAFAKGNGIILLSAHFTDIEIGGRLLGMEQAIEAVYRGHETPYFEKFITAKRARYVNATIEKNNIRGMIRSLKKNHIVWYAPDQNFSGKNSIEARFFNQPAPSNPATARLAKMTNAAVIPFVQYRREDGSGYDLKILPALNDFPSGNDEIDMQKVNDTIEDLARLQPSHYYWVHRRFKRLTDGRDVYSES